jgi:hypothetical protein
MITPPTIPPVCCGEPVNAPAPAVCCPAPTICYPSDMLTAPESPIILDPPSNPQANNYADTIATTWPWVRTYPPWIAELKLALDDFGRSTGLKDRTGQEGDIYVGDILSATLQAPCPCANTPFNRTDWYAVQAMYGPPPRPTAAVAKINRKVCAPPWNVEDCNPERPLPVNFLPRPPKPYTYFVYYDTVRQVFVGRSFFQCETIKPSPQCTHGESDYFYIIDFSKLEYIGNLVDTPEKFVMTLASEIPGVASSDVQKFGSSYVKKIRDAQHFR